MCIRDRVTVSDNKTIGLISLLSPGEKYISSYFFMHINSDTVSYTHLLKPGLKQLEEMTGIPVLGVLPYFKLHIPSEDSVSLEDKKNSKNEKGIEIVVIRLPRISNFTDFEPLEELAHIRYVNLYEEIGTPDAIIIPGTKNTVNDLIDLNASGMAEKIKAFKGKIPIFGICGGYQIMGKTIFDSGVENGIEAEFKGLGLLDVVTKFGPYKKKMIQVTKKVNPCGPILTPIGLSLIHI